MTIRKIEAEERRPSRQIVELWADCGVRGMPLAIELAAAWLNMLSLAEIAAELSHELDLLASELRDVPNRHGVCGWSLTVRGSV